MSLVAESIPNLMNGVSQQPFALRLASQAELQVNGDSSVVEGLRKRPATRHVARLLTSVPAGALFHTINRDQTERYKVVFTGSDLKVFDLAGNEIAVSFPDGKSYITVANPKATLKALTVADYTFVINTATVVAADPANIFPSRTPDAQIWVRTGDYSKKYTVTLNGTPYSFTTDATSAASIQTTNIATQLASLIPAAFAPIVRGSLIYLKRTDNADFTISVNDSAGDTGLYLAKGSVQRFNLLPEKGYPGFLTRVSGDKSDNNFDAYYVQFNESADTTGNTWKETAKPGEQKGINTATMPWVLVRNTDGTFTFKKGAWTDRTVGDLEHDPLPSFVGQTISDIGFHKNRLVILAGENVCMSAVGEPFRFFRSTIIQVLDDDPIDVAVGHVKVSNLNHVVSFNETLVFFSGFAQFKLGDSELLTPKSVSIAATTDFECSAKVKPVGAGKNIYFVQERGNFSAVREYYIDQDSVTEDAAEVTSHVPKYIPSNVTKLVSSTTEDIMFAMAEGAPNRLYVYRYHYQDRTKVQSSWSYWEWESGCKILNADFIDSVVYLDVQRADGVYLEYMHIEAGYVDGTATFAPLLDHILTDAAVTGWSYDSVTKRTAFTIPYDVDVPSAFKLIIWTGDDTYPLGYVPALAFSGSGNRTITVPGRVTKFRLGRTYVFRYRFSQFALRVSDGQSSVPLANQRVQVRGLDLTYANSGYFRADVTIHSRTSGVYEETGMQIGDGLVIGQAPIRTGTKRIPIFSQAMNATLDLINDSPLPCYFLSAEWEGFFVQRARRM